MSAATTIEWHIFLEASTLTFVTSLRSFASARHVSVRDTVSRGRVPTASSCSSRLVALHLSLDHPPTQREIRSGIRESEGNLNDDADATHSDTCIQSLDSL